MQSDPPDRVEVTKIMQELEEKLAAQKAAAAGAASPTEPAKAGTAEPTKTEPTEPTKTGPTEPLEDRA